MWVYSTNTTADRRDEGERESRELRCHITGKRLADARVVYNTLTHEKMLVIEIKHSGIFSNFTFSDSLDII